MTQVVTVRTDFADLNQMAQGLVGRVNETHVILPAGAPVDVGEWAQFAVTLHDGTPGFAGMGRCVTFVDNGEERQSHQRFDVVFDSLQFDPRGHQIYAHILALSGYGFEGAEQGASEASDHHEQNGAAEATSEAADADDDAYADAPPEEPAASATPSEPVEVGDSIPVTDAAESADEEETSEATVIAARGDLQAALMAPEPQAVPVSAMRTPVNVPAPAAPAAIGASALAVDVYAQYSAEPVADGAFDYASGLPFPAVPPRPPLGEGQRVTPAPRPH